MILNETLKDRKIRRMITPRGPKKGDDRKDTMPNWNKRILCQKTEESKVLESIDNIQAYKGIISKAPNMPKS